MSPFACALINGHTLVKAPLFGEQNAGVSLHCDPSLWCFPELSVVYYSPNIVQQEGVQWRGVLWLDDAPLELGMVEKKRANQSVVVPLEFVPTTVRLEVHRCVPQTTSLERVSLALVDAVVAVLEDPVGNPRQGSLELTTVTKEVQERESYLYNAMESEKPGGFQELVHSEQERFSVFSYSESEIKDRKMEGHVAPGEPRIVLKQRSAIQFYDDDDEERLLAYLKETLSKRSYVCDDLLLKLYNDSKSDTFAYPLSPAFSLLMRFLRRNTQLFSWSTDPNQVTMISLKPQGKAPLPAPPAAKPRQQAQNNAQGGARGTEAASPQQGEKGKRQANNKRKAKRRSYY
eukprot:TRINITY_DN404_c1_g1_i1.p1 TRINITY_DN404_c1_g1~~TRINITY_DN404_c1_g1_i1.p1  ORF type:complete len:345 (+),score=159.16 TRINITY_DN404_c1_g1_i1:76-1110(+)